MKAYCINLDRRPDRLAHMTTEFAKAGIPFERIPAVDGQNPDVAAAAARLPLSTIHGARIGVGAYGCLQSHRLFWQRLIDSGDAWGMVFEDDLLLAPGMMGLLAEQWIPEDADIVKLETYLSKRFYVSALRREAVGGRYLARLCSTHLGTGCYVISGAVARRMMVATETIGEAIDQVLFDQKLGFFQTLVTYQMISAPVIQGVEAAYRARKAKAVGEGQPADWHATSITERLVDAKSEASRKSETSLERLRRRISAEIWSRLRGQRYVFVHHG